MAACQMLRRWKNATNTTSGSCRKRSFATRRLTAFQFQWRQIQFAFALPDPYKFPPLPLKLNSDELEVIRRYVSACEELATYSLLHHKGGLTVSWTEGQGTRLEIDNPPKEALRGFAVLFRQMHSDDPASFKATKDILAKASRSAHDSHSQLRMDYIKQWSRARAKLQFTLHDLVQSTMLESRGAAPELVEIKRADSPVQLISLFNYGEYIHWGNKRAEHESLFQDSIVGALSEYRFHSSLIGLSHFYLGFAKLLDAAAAEQ